MAAVWRVARDSYQRTWNPVRPVDNYPFTTPPTGARLQSPIVRVTGKGPLTFVDLTTDSKDGGFQVRQHLQVIVLSDDDDDDDDDDVHVVDHAQRSGGRVRAGRTGAIHGNGGFDHRFGQASLHNLYGLSLGALEVVVASVRNANQTSGQGNPQYIVTARLDDRGRVHYRVQSRDVRDQRLARWGSRLTSISEFAIRNQHGGEFLGPFRMLDGSAHVQNIRDFLFILDARYARQLVIGRDLLMLDSPDHSLTIDSLF